MTTKTEQSANDDFTKKLLDAAVRLGALALILTWCFQIVSPFVIPLVWGIIIAVALFPAYRPLIALFGGRRGLAATVVTLVILILLMVPTIKLTEVLARNVATLTEEFSDGKVSIPPPPENVSQWPIVGEPLADLWGMASTNITDTLKLLQPQIKAIGGWLLEITASAGMSILMFIFAFIISGILLAHSEAGHRLAHGIATRLVGDRGPDLANLAEATVRGVTRGVLGVAVIQALLAGIGFVVVGIPAAGVWALLCLIFAVIQIGVGPIMIPAIIYVFSTGETMTAILFLIWGVLVLLIDNFLKPILMGRGVDVPMVVIFLGAIGGMLLSGIIGLFVGAVVLALGYKLFQAWLNLEDRSIKTT